LDSGKSGQAYSEGATAESNTRGAQATITFTGTGIDWVGARGPQTGIAHVFLDGSFVGDIDMYFPTEGPQHTVFSAKGLGSGNACADDPSGHQSNPASTDVWILIDAFDVTP